ncbi:type VI secretion system lipoprotein TssJ [Fundidesulfovibrio agrisoli]|uniref:type VI secretion system lipoprotein TssJ n=1 Tax=Fundidesulfovibrio agrisoli TaxID=2922717 RepID=UPI001FAE1D72|nr:type VI secretion system lipoprotein TssJ [Fundidesulfovibrio agrisoli]
MRKLLTLMAMLALVAFSAFSAGCGTGGPTAAPQKAEPSYSPEAGNWSYAPKALELTLTADPFLNEYGGAAHPLDVCVYQLASPAAFKDLAASPTGVSSLVECREFDSSVVGAQRVKVQPGSSETLRLDRAENARFVAVACAYYDQNQGRTTRIYEIPLNANTSGWFWWKETNYEAGKLTRKILLGKTGILDAD